MQLPPELSESRDSLLGYKHEDDADAKSTSVENIKIVYGQNSKESRSTSQ